MRVDVSVECLRVWSLQSSDLVARVYLGSTHPSTRGYEELAHRLYSGENMMSTKAIFQTSIMELDFFRKHFWYNQVRLLVSTSSKTSLSETQDPENLYPVQRHTPI